MVEDTFVEGVGWGVASLLLFGSQAVPLKSPAVVAAKVDPVVYQCYKASACFTTCWLALLAVPFRFTWFGVAGAAIWTVNGVCAVAAVQRAGIGVSQTLWSGLSVLVAFVWGVYVFDEPIANVGPAWASLLVMCAGMGAIGVAAGYGAPPTPPVGCCSSGTPPIRIASPFTLDSPRIACLPRLHQPPPTPATSGASDCVGLPGGSGPGLHHGLKTSLSPNTCSHKFNQAMIRL